MTTMTRTLTNLLLFLLGTIKGYYLYIETSWPRKLNDTARLTSAPFRPAVKADNCYMRFFYHMFGDHVNALNVYMKTTQYYKSPMKVIWSKSGTFLFII